MGLHRDSNPGPPAKAILKNRGLQVYFPEAGIIPLDHEASCRLEPIVWLKSGVVNLPYMGNSPMKAATPDWLSGLVLHERC